MTTLNRPRTSMCARRFPVVTMFLVALALIATGCSANLRTGDVEIQGIVKFKLPAFPKTGVHKVQIFNEMHYQPSYRFQEGPRLLPPLDSVPVTGRELRYATLDEYRELTVPDRFAGEYVQSAAQHLYSINCMVCHGLNLRGEAEEDETVKAKIFPFLNRGPFPADLISEIATDSTNGELFAFISKGGRQGFAAIERGRASVSPMPEFQRLLTEEERWMLVMYLRSQQSSPQGVKGVP